MKPDLVLVNSRVMTMNAAQPTAECVAISGDRIVWVGNDEGLPSVASVSCEVIDCQGKTLLPGFIDAHCHLLAYVSSFHHVDCSSDSVSSIVDIKNALQDMARQTPQGQWIRASGYSEFDLLEKRHPNRWDLDDDVPNHPVRLDHYSRHAMVLNSKALELVSISTSSEEWLGGTIDRDPETGEPTGLLLEYNGYISKFIPSPSREQIEEGLRKANVHFLEYGVTSIQDASPANNLERWRAFSGFKGDGQFVPRITMMAGGNHIRELMDSGLRFGLGNNHLNLGHVKFIVTSSGGRINPSIHDLASAIVQVHKAGFPIAIHAVEEESVLASLQALIDSAKSSSGTFLDRIEHLSECSPKALELLSRCKPTIVTQPGLIYSNGRRYLSEVPDERQPWLYKFGTFQSAGALVAGSSDAPLSEPNPILGIYSAITRRASTGEIVNGNEGTSMDDALAMFTLNAAKASGQEKDKGSIEVGKLADLILLEDELMPDEPERLLSNRVAMTIVGGNVVWEA